MATETETETDQSAAEREAEVDYLEQEISIINPNTPFMRDNLKVLWGTFLLWILAVFGPVTATAIAPGVMTETMVLGFQLHYFLTALIAPLGALLLSVVYAYQRDRLDDKYDISHSGAADEPSGTPAADGSGEEAEG